jgi:GTP cyclohydrolase I
MTVQVANAINDVLEPKGVAVVLDAAHECMTCRGVHKNDSTTITSRMVGLFRSDARTRSEFLRLALDK